MSDRCEVLEKRETKFRKWMAEGKCWVDSMCTLKPKLPDELSISDLELPKVIIVLDTINQIIRYLKAERGKNG